MKISKGIGIDLGTTNSCVAMMDLIDSTIMMSQDKHGVATTPSCVWYDEKKGEIVVGKRAFRQRGGYPEPIVSIKRSMGTSQHVKVAGKERSPEEISAEILKELRRQIEEAIRAELAASGQQFIIDRAIITIPAYFQLPAIEATRKRLLSSSMSLQRRLYIIPGSITFRWIRIVFFWCLTRAAEPLTYPFCGGPLENQKSWV